MTRFLIEVAPDKVKTVQEQLATIGITPISVVFNYITVDVPDEFVPKIRAIPGVVAVIPEKPVEIKILPVEKKLKMFFQMAANPFTLLQALQFSLQETSSRWPTFESRKMVGADIAEADGITGKGVKVAVVDTGHDPLDAQLPGLMGMSSVEGQPIDLDENGHGTHVTSTIGGRYLTTPFGAIYGVAPGAEMGVFKCLGYGMGAGTTTSVIRAMADALAWGADIISMSLGGPEEDPATSPECRIAKALADQGIILCIAAGNDGPEASTLGTPGNSPDVLTIGAIDADGKIADFSSRGPAKHTGEIKPDCVTPGVNILSSTCGMIDAMQWMDGPKLGAISGTSMATPHASGVVALLVELYRAKGVKLTTAMLKSILGKYGEEKSNDRGWGLLTYQLGKRYLESL